MKLSELIAFLARRLSEDGDRDLKKFTTNALDSPVAFVSGAYLDDRGHLNLMGEQGCDAKRNGRPT